MGGLVDPQILLLFVHRRTFQVYAEATAVPTTEDRQSYALDCSNAHAKSVPQIARERKLWKGGGRATTAIGHVA